MPDAKPNRDSLAFIEGVVHRTRARRQRDRLVVGTAWTIAISLGALLALAALDMLTPLEVPMRMAAASALALLATGAAGVCVARPIARPESISRVAHLIENAIKGMHNRLITALDLRRESANESEAKLADPFVQRLLEQTMQRLQGFSPSMVTDPAPLKRSLSAAFAAVLIGLLILGITKERFLTAVQRLLQPTAAIAPISSVVYEVIPRNANVLEGDGITLAAKFIKGSDPHMTVRIKPVNGAWTSYPLDPGGDGQPSFQLSSVNEPMQYQVVGGGTWSPVYQISVIRRPRVENITAAVRLPDYMQISQARLIEGDLSVISAPVGSTIEVTASIAGHAAKGSVKTFKSVSTIVKEKSEPELVWFDDALPADAEPVGTWRWVTDPAHSGTKAFAFDWARRPFGFKTRLAALPIGAGSSLFVYTFLDPSDAPGRITMTAAIGTRFYAIHFTNPAKAADPAWLSGQKTPIPANTVAIDGGQLPQPGRWARLSIPIEKIVGAPPAAPVEVTGLSFELDAGRATLDRVGSFQSVTREVTQKTLEPIATFAFAPQAAATQSATQSSSTPAPASASSSNWIASLPVDKDYLFNVEFTTEQGHASPAVAPMSVVATADTAPKIVLEKPTQNITLAQPQPVPVMLRVFDDYGIADVGVQIGKSPTEFEPVRWFKTYDSNMTSDLVLTSLDPAELKLVPGGAVFFQLITRDRKGQVATTLPLRLALAAPSEVNSAAVDKGSAPLAPILDTLKKLVGAQATLAGKAAGLLDSFDIKRDVPTTQLGKTPVVTTQTAAAGDPKIDPKASKEPDKQQEEAVAKALAQAETDRQAMIKQLDDAAAAAQKSASALPGEAQLLSTMSWQLQQASLEQKALTAAALAATDRAAKQKEPNPELDKAVADRLKKLAELTEDQKKEMEDLTRQLKQLEAARKDMATDPQAAQDRMQALLTEQRGQQANNQLDALDDTLDDKRQQLEDLREQIAALKEQTATASPEQLDAIAKAVAEAEKEALDEMKEVKDLLRDEQAGMNEQQQEDEMPAPWDPPGQEHEATPVERDTPEKKDPKDPAKKDDKAKQAKSDKEREKEEWDDVPELPQIASRTKEDERYKNKDQRPDEVDESEELEDSPTDSKRKRMEKNQGRFEQALTAAAKRAQSSQSKMNQMQSEMNSAMQKMAEQSESSPSQAAKTAQQLQKMLNSDAMKSAASAARRAQQHAAAEQAAKKASQAASAAAKPGGQQSSGKSGKVDGRDKLDELTIPPMGLIAGPPEGVSGSDRGVIMSVDLSGIDISKQASGFYRLPPHIRDPLIQGLKEAAPEGYQPLIDAYYRQLGAEGK